MGGFSRATIVRKCQTDSQITHSGNVLQSSVVIVLVQFSGSDDPLRISRKKLLKAKRYTHLFRRQHSKTVDEKGSLSLA